MKEQTTSGEGKERPIRLREEMKKNSVVCVWGGVDPCLRVKNLFFIFLKILLNLSSRRYDIPTLN